MEYDVDARSVVWALSADFEELETEDCMPWHCRSLALNRTGGSMRLMLQNEPRHAQVVGISRSHAYGRGANQFHLFGARITMRVRGVILRTHLAITHFFVYSSQWLFEANYTIHLDLRRAGLSFTSSPHHRHLTRSLNLLFPKTSILLCLLSFPLKTFLSPERR